MAGKTQAEAVQRFLDPLRLALSCVTKSVLQVGGGYHQSVEPHAATLGSGLPVELKGGRLALTVTLHYRIVEHEGARGPWKVSTVAYYYRLTTTPDEKEVLAYHWHPAGRSRVTWPHLHVTGGDVLGGAHLPTGRVALEQVLRLSITELSVEPIREDWADVLDATQEAFEQWRTWP